MLPALCCLLLPLWVGGQSGRARFFDRASGRGYLFDGGEEGVAEKGAGLAEIGGYICGARSVAARNIRLVIDLCGAVTRFVAVGCGVLILGCPIPFPHVSG